MAEAHPDFRIARVALEQVVVEVDGLGVITDAAQHHRLQVVATGIARIVAQQALDLDQRLLGLVGPIQDQRVVLPRRVEAGRELEAAHQQFSASSLRPSRAASSANMRIAATSVGAFFRCSRSSNSASGMRLSASAAAASSRAGSRVE
jgi:hypothetical protein